MGLLCSDEEYCIPTLIFCFLPFLSPFLQRTNNKKKTILTYMKLHLKINKYTPITMHAMETGKRSRVPITEASRNQIIIH